MPETTGLVAWEGLKVGETYWVVWPHSLTPVKVSIRENQKEGFYDNGNVWWSVDDFTWDDAPMPMIYATCAGACDAMIQRLQKFMAEQGEGNG